MHTIVFEANRVTIFLLDLYNYNYYFNNFLSGYFSFRNKKGGSWFVHELSEVFTKYAESKEYLQLLTITNRNVAQNRESCCLDSRKNGKKQTLCLTSTLTRAIDFKKRIEIN